MRTGILLQVRLDSKRLNRKALLPLGEATVVELAMAALKKVKVQEHCLVTDEQSYNELKPLAQKQSFDIFKGPKDDVLKRYALAARCFDLDCIVRATGDNPFVSPLLCEMIMEEHRKAKADLSHYLDMPLGTGVEVVEARVLYEADKKSSDPFEREHITTYLYRNRGVFKVLEKICPANVYLPGSRVSLDTEKDYLLIKQIFNDLYQGQPLEASELVEWFKNQQTGAEEAKNESDHFSQQPSR
ncbi:MAG: acylneuraminate cytidylyltransferase [Spirochaetales bacterium]|nr:acylneuraminate cytidylyltransferase [Spirochaetales bacterium]